MDGLSVVPTDDLIEELKKRFDHTIFFGLRAVSVEKNGTLNWETKRRHSGNGFMCLGLCDNMKAYINGGLMMMEKPTDGKGT